MSAEPKNFEITTDLATIRDAKIDANFAEVSAWLDSELAPYLSLQVTEDMIAPAKTYRARIRKVRDRIDQVRKEAKAAAMAAYEPFEMRCKELTGKCDNAANAIDAQVKAFEAAEKDAKIAALKAYYDEAASGEVSAYCLWESIYNPKWENKGYSAEAAQGEISGAVTRVKADLETIRTIGGDDTPYLLDFYRSARDISMVVRKASEISAMRAKEEERKRREIDRVNAARTSATVPESRPVAVAPAESDAEDNAEDSAEETRIIDFRVEVTMSQLYALKDFLLRNRIRYGRVPD